jgi:type II secretion system protein I
MHCRSLIVDCRLRAKKNSLTRISPFGEGELLNRQSSIVNHQSEGFTLLEVMVAVSIMATVLVVLLGLKNRSMQDVALDEHITMATILAKRTMVDVMFSKPRQPTEDEGTFPEEEYKDYTWKKTVSATPFVELMEVRVAVLWKEGERPEMVELVSYE